MDLSKKKKLAMKTFGVGARKVLFLESRLEEIKDAITKQDIRDLEKSGAIVVLKIKGRTKVRKKASRSVGNVRKKSLVKKREYIIITRKLRGALKNLVSRGDVSKKDSYGVLNRIKNREFKSKAHFRELIKPRAMESKK